MGPAHVVSAILGWLKEHVYPYTMNSQRPYPAVHPTAKPFTYTQTGELAMDWDLACHQKGKYIRSLILGPVTS